MAVRVVANLVSRGQDGAGNLRTPADILADKKKSRFGFMLRQHVQQVEGVRIVGAIVKGKRHLIGIAAMRERAAIKLRARRHGGVSGIAGRGR